MSTEPPDDRERVRSTDPCDDATDADAVVLPPAEDEVGATDAPDTDASMTALVGGELGAVVVASAAAVPVTSAVTGGSVSTLTAAGGVAGPIGFGADVLVVGPLVVGRLVVVAAVEALLVVTATVAAVGVGAAEPQSPGVMGFGVVPATGGSGAKRGGRASAPGCKRAKDQPSIDPGGGVRLPAPNEL